MKSVVAKSTPSNGKTADNDDLKMTPLPTTKRFSWFPVEASIGGRYWRPRDWWEEPPTGDLYGGEEITYGEDESMFRDRAGVMREVAEHNREVLVKIADNPPEEEKLIWLVAIEWGTPPKARQWAFFEWTPLRRWQRQFHGPTLSDC